MLRGEMSAAEREQAVRSGEHVKGSRVGLQASGVELERA
jgi:hypothetical protein